MEETTQKNIARRLRSWNLDFGTPRRPGIWRAARIKPRSRKLGLGEELEALKAELEDTLDSQLRSRSSRCALGLTALLTGDGVVVQGKGALASRGDPRASAHTQVWPVVMEPGSSGDSEGLGGLV